MLRLLAAVLSVVFALWQHRRHRLRVAARGDAEGDVDF